MVILIICVAVLCLLACTYLFLIAPAYNARGSLSLGITSFFAHRGLYGGSLPENSLEAFKNAVGSGCGIELDVRLSADGEVMVFHDGNLKRMCGVDYPFGAVTSGNLARLRLDRTNCGIPKLSEVLAAVNGAVPLIIELKGEDKNTELCDKLFPLLDGYSGVFFIESFNPLLLAYVKKHRPAYIRGQLVDILSKESYSGSAIVRFMLSHMLLNFLSRPHFIAYNHKKKPFIGIFLCSFLFGAHRFAWTVTDKKQFDALRLKGIHSIFEGFWPY